MTGTAIFEPTNLTTSPRKPWIYAAGLLTSALAFAGPPTTAATQLVPAIIAEQLSWTTAALGQPRLSDLSGVVRRLKDRSGLSWQQLADAFGVSRRSLHFWVNGGNMSNSNLSRLRDLTALVDRLGLGDPQAVRSVLLVPQEGGRSLLDDFIATATAHRVETKSRAADDLDAIHGATQHRGRVVRAETVPVKLRDI